MINTFLRFPIIPRAKSFLNRCYPSSHQSGLSSKSNSSSYRHGDTVDLAYSLQSPSGKVNEKPPLVILHGLNGSKYNWFSLAKQYARDLRREIIVVDARNHGDSPHHDSMDYRDMAGDVARLLDRLGFGSYHVLGHSMGGKTVMALALLRPELFTSLIVEDSVPAASPHLVKVQGYVEALLNVPLNQPVASLPEARRIAMKFLAPRIPDVNIRAFLLLNLVMDGDKLKWRFNLRSICKNLQSIGAWPDEHFLGLKFNGHTIFIGGANSDYTMSDGKFVMEDRILEYFPTARFEIIPNAGHWIHSENPKDFSRVVIDHINRVEA